MKTLFLALALVVATAAPSVALEINSSTISGTFGR